MPNAMSTKYYSVLSGLFFHKVTTSWHRADCETIIEGEEHLR